MVKRTQPAPDPLNDGGGVGELIGELVVAVEMAVVVKVPVWW